MVRTNIFGKGKGKEKASSSTPKDTSATKKRKTSGVVIRDAPVHEEEEEEEIVPPSIPYRANWTGGPLYKQRPCAQPELFYEKMGDDHSIRENMCFEKEVYRPDFRALGFEEKLKALGWEALVNFRGNENGDIYLKSVMAWLSTLTRDDGTNPPKTITLSGTVGDNTAVLSFATLKQLARFDSKGDKFYRYVDENEYWVHPYQTVEEHVLLAALFDEKKGCELKRDNLKPIVRVLLQFVIFNIAPRLGDRMAVRKWEVPVLYAIMTGQLKLSFCQLVIMHVWQARNAKGKKLIPHARLLSALLEKQGALKKDEVPLRKPHTIFSLPELASTTWVYKKTKKWHKLKMGPGERVKVLQWGKQPLAQGEMDDQDSSDEELMRRKREAGVISGEGTSEPQPGEHGYSWGVFDDEMQARVTSMRPSEYNTFEQFQQCLFDHTSRIDVTRSREHEEMLAYHRETDRIRHIESQMELNMRAYDENQYRRHLDYYNGVPYVENPPYVDYSALESYQPGMPRHPSPQVHGSMWLPQEYTAPHFQSSYPYQQPPYEYPQQQQDDQGAGGVFDMSSFYEHLGGYYGGPPGPSYR